MKENFDSKIWGVLESKGDKTNISRTAGQIFMFNP